MKTILTLIIHLICFSTFSQSFIGQVLDAGTQQPIPFATIVMTETENGVIADSEGHFYIESFPRTILKLQISSVGYETYVENIDLSKAAKELFLLEPSHFELNEIVVSFPVSKLNDENVVEVEAKRITSLSPDINLSASLASMPGVDQVSTGSGIGKPVIRGLSGNRIVVYTQNIRLENQQFGDEHGLGENAIGINRVEVIKGPASLLYGADALGGVLYLVPDSYALLNETEGFVKSGYSSNMQMIQTGAGIKLNRNGMKFNGFGAYNTSADYNTPGSLQVLNTRFDELSLKGSLGYNRKNWVGNLRYAYLKNNFGIPDGELGTSGGRARLLPSQFVTQHNVSLENVFFLGKNELSAIVGYGVNGRQEFEYSFDDAALDMMLKTTTLNVRSITQLSDKVSLTGGFQGMSQINKNAGEELLIPDATIHDAGIYGVVNAELPHDLQLQGGARVDYRNISTSAYSDTEKSILALDRNFSSANFSLGSIYKKQKLTYRLNIASGFRPPNTAELLSDGEHEGTLRYEIGNPELDSERAFQFDLNVEFENQHLTIGINPFYNRMQNYIFLSPRGDAMDGADVFEYLQKDAKLYGGEVGVHFHPHSIHWLHLETNFSSVFAEDDNGNALPLIPANKLKIRLSTEFLLNKKPNGSFYIQYLYKRSQDRVVFSERETPSYHLFDAGISVEKGHAEVLAGINNLLDTRYVDHLSRLKNDGIPNPGRNIFVGLKYNF